VIRRIIDELRLFCRVLDPPAIASVYIGGGTPNLLDRRELDQLLSAVTRELEHRGRGTRREGTSQRAPEPSNASVESDPPGFEWTVEANPEFLNAEQLELMQRRGVTRLSMGVQSFRPQILSRLDRNADAAAVERALELTASHWRGELNLDMIAGIPGRSPEEERDDVSAALSYAPGHLSVYALTIEEGTALAEAAAEGTLPPRSEDDVAESLQLIADCCAEAGYGHYEISNYAPPGRESLHNIRYWRMQPYLGIGPSAVSTLPGEEGPLRLTGKTKGRGYESETVLPVDFFLEHLMMGLRTSEGVSSSKMEAIFGTKPGEIIPRSVEQAVRNGLLRFHGDSLRPTIRGMLLLDRLLVDMATELEANRESFSSTRLSWPQPPTPDGRNGPLRPHGDPKS
jgi:oxygen-independent coproporphyrinogen-3 oxidase